MTTHERVGDENCNGNGKYLSWGFLKRLGIVLGGLVTFLAMFISVYCWIDAKIETKMDRALMMELMTKQTKSFEDAMTSQSASFRETMGQQSGLLNKMTVSQEEMSRQLHTIDVRLVKIETKLENK